MNKDQDKKDALLACKLFLNGKEIPIAEPPKIEFKHVHDVGPQIVNKYATIKWDPGMIIDDNLGEITIDPEWAAYVEAQYQRTVDQLGIPKMIQISVDWSKVSYVEALRIYEAARTGLPLDAVCRKYRPIICSHCQDRELWQLGLFATLVGPICNACLDACLARGITLQTIVRGKLIVIRKLHRSK